MAGSPAFLDEVPEDGRRARRHRSRDLVVDALLDLLDHGVLRPTAQQVAERSGVSLRSIFRIFDDVETLHAAAAAQQLARVRHLFVDVAAVGTLAERVDEMVAINARLYESVAPVRRAALRAAPESASLREQLGRVRDWLRAEIDRVFSEELAAAANPAVASAVEMAMSFEAWDQLRTSQLLSPVDAAGVVRGTALALLGGQTR
jgi:TetR/AcrR family transcriptional regulator of autoinduction and epiphytic fitness